MDALGVTARIQISEVTSLLMGLKCLVSRKQQSYSEVLTRQFFSTLIAQDVFCSFTQGQSLSNGSPSFVGGAQNPSWFWAGKNRPKQQLVSREDLDDEPYSPSYTGERMAHVESVEEGNGSSDESLPEIADPPEYVVPLPLFTKYANGDGSQGQWSSEDGSQSRWSFEV